MDDGASEAGSEPLSTPRGSAAEGSEAGGPEETPPRALHGRGYWDALDAVHSLTAFGSGFGVGFDVTESPRKCAFILLLLSLGFDFVWFGVVPLLSSRVSPLYPTPDTSDSYP